MNYLLVNNYWQNKIYARKKYKKYRNKKGISQDKLAKISGVTYNTIAKIESGATQNPRVNTLQQIASALGTNVDRLLRER